MADLRAGLSRYTVAFLAAGLLDLARTVFYSDALSFAQLAASLGIVVGSWCLLALVWTASSTLVLRLVLGSNGASRLHAAVASYALRVRQERDNETDAGRFAGIVALLAAVAIVLPASVGSTAYLIENRHGSLLIAITAQAGQLVFLLVAVAIALIVFRLVRTAVRRAKSVPSLRWLNSVNLLLLIVGGGLLALTAGLVRAWVIVEQVDGVAILIGLAGIVIGIGLGFVPESWAAQRWLASRWRGMRWFNERILWLLPAVSLAVLWLGAQNADAYNLLVKSDATKHLLSTLAQLSDFDRDGSASFPRFSDCKPFNTDVNPQAREIPNNGIDENCDGKDGASHGTQHQAAVAALPIEGKPNLVLVTFDATRADHMGFMGYERNTTPNLNRLAKEGVVFERAFSQDSGTTPSFWSFSAGKTPFQVRFKSYKWPPTLDPEENLLAEVLSANGYTTEWLMCGGTSRLKSGYAKAINVCTGPGDKKPASEKTADRAIAELEHLKNEQPFFLWVHFFDPHGPYMHYPTRSFGDRDVDLYDEAIAYSDEHFGRFREALQEIENDHPTFIAFGADHGENFHEHGNEPHARTLYREVTNVPLVISGPGVTPRHVSTPVALNDLYPTFLHLAGAEIPESCTMQSQAAVLFGAEADAQRMVFQENSFSTPLKHLRAVVSGQYHLILDLTNDVSELYNFETEPKERKNLVGTGLAEEARLREAMRDFLTTSEYPGGGGGGGAEE